FIHEVYKEWDAQIELIRTSFPMLEIQALDSHNHIHLIPSLFKVANNLAYKHQIKNIRVTDESFYLAHISDLWKTTYLVNVVKWVLLRILVSFSKAKGTEKYQAALGVLYSGQMFSKSVKAGIRSASKINNTKLEVFFHVGRCSNDELADIVRSESAVRFFTHTNRDLEFNTVENLRNEK
ncbi:MAG: ChbG/HpnK family deacetylase, partial [Chitinophagaceae bacterium]|nr:ChbG/HpnK family deacetylase [Chitinophagaceae bacterium]